MLTVAFASYRFRRRRRSAIFVHLKATQEAKGKEGWHGRINDPYPKMENMVE
jgi:hypothetical protein